MASSSVKVEPQATASTTTTTPTTLLLHLNKLFLQNMHVVPID